MGAPHPPAWSAGCSLAITAVALAVVGCAAVAAVPGLLLALGPFATRR